MANRDKEFNRLLTDIRMSLDKPQMTVESLLFPEEHEENQVPASEEPVQGTEEDDMLSAEVEKNPMLNEPKMSGAEKAIADIRKIAINTLAQLAEQPNSEEYIMLKKIWVMCDKAVEGDDNTKKNNTPA